jgi:hypothetical protein
MVGAPANARDGSITKGRGLSMPPDEESARLSARGVTPQQSVALVQSMLVDWRVMEHLQRNRVVEDAFALREDGCCKPDGGSCCVNAKRL